MGDNLVTVKEKKKQATINRNKKTFEECVPINLDKTSFDPIRQILSHQNPDLQNSIFFEGTIDQEVSKYLSPPCKHDDFQQTFKRRLKSAGPLRVNNAAVHETPAEFDSANAANPMHRARKSLISWPKGPR